MDEFVVALTCGCYKVAIERPPLGDARACEAHGDQTICRVGSLLPPPSQPRT
jgi:hypothetical protein